MNARDESTGRRLVPTAEHPEVRVVASARTRGVERLDHGLVDPPADPSIADLVRAVGGIADARRAGSWMIVGGEPTLRPDLPALVAALAEAGAPHLGLVTDGLALAGGRAAQVLASRGLQRVRLRLAGARADAHDWLHGAPGAWRRAIKAVRSCVDAGLELEVECTITRPTFAHAEEAMELFGRLGARAVVLRRVTARGPAAAHDVALLPRFGLITGELERAVQVGVRAGCAVMVEGFPRCALPGAAGWFVPQDAVRWAVPAGGPWAWLAPAFEPPPTERGCAGCPGDATCAGAPGDYTRRFGRAEIDSESVRLVHPGQLEPTPLAGGEAYPPARRGRFPQSRLSYARLATRLPSLGGDPLVAVAPVASVTRGLAADRLRCVFLAPSTIADPVLGDHPGPDAPEPSRAARIRLVTAAQQGVTTLRVAGGGTLSHPAVADLLRETTRLQLPRVEVAGEASGLDRCSDMDLRRLRGITRVDVALFGPDAATHDAVVGREGAFDAALRALDRLGTLVPSIEVGAYAVLTSHQGVEAFAEAWDAGDLPGTPWFRLAPRGGSLAALAAAAEALPPGPARDALAAVLPTSLLPRPSHVVPAPAAEDAWGDVPDAYRGPSGSDRFGCYTDRLPSDPAQPGGDPGHAVGWVTGA